MGIERDDLIEIGELLTVLLDDFPSKTKDELAFVIDSLEKATDTSDVLKIMDDLEVITNSPNLDNFARNEIMNVIASLDEIVNS